MRRVLLSITLVAVAILVIAPAAEATLTRYVSATTDWLSLRKGRGTAAVASVDGAILGKIGRGRLVVTDVLRGAPTTIRISGCETRKRLSARKQVCKGWDIRFSIYGGAWRASMTRRGINASAVLRGSVTLEGTRGTYSIDGSSPRPWPRTARTFTLGG